MNIRPCAMCGSSARSEAYHDSENVCSAACDSALESKTADRVSAGEMERAIRAAHEADLRRSAEMSG